MHARAAAQQYPLRMPSEVVHMTLEEFGGGFVGPPTGDDVSLSVDGRRLDSKTAVLAWWAEVAGDVEAEEAAGQSRAGRTLTGWLWRCATCTPACASKG